MYARGALKWLLIIILSITIAVMLHNNISTMSYYCNIIIGLSVKDFIVERSPLLFMINNITHPLNVVSMC